MIDNELPWWILTGIIHINGGWWYVFQLLEGCKILYPATIIATNQVGESKHSGLWSNWCCDWRLAVCLVLAKLNWKEDPKEDHDIRTVKTIKPQDGWFHTKTDKLYRSRWYLNDVKDDIHGIHSPESSQNSGGYSSHPYLQFLPKHGWSNLGSCVFFDGSTFENRWAMPSKRVPTGSQNIPGMASFRLRPGYQKTMERCREP